MVNLQGIKNQARINMQKGQNLTSKEYPTKKCMNRGRWVGSGLKVTALCINMDTRHDLSRINSRNINEHCRSMKKEEDPSGSTSIRHLQL